MNARMSKDIDTCDRILDDEFLLSSARGMLMPKAGWLVNAKRQFSCESFEWLEILVRPFDPFAIVHSRTRQRGVVGKRRVTSGSAAGACRRNACVFRSDLRRT